MEQILDIREVILIEAQRVMVVMFLLVLVGKLDTAKSGRSSTTTGRL
jgi:hypothetical protein